MRRGQLMAAAALAALASGGCFAGALPDEPGGGPSDVPPPSGCPAAPAGTAERASTALETVNRWRRAAGVGCMEHIAEIAAAAEHHCAYYAANSGSCTAKPHRELASCARFTGETFNDRMRASAYRGQPGYEVMAYLNDGRLAVGDWLDSIWHRIPLFSPRVDQLGYGAASRCDTMDFGTSDRPLQRKNVFFPFAGQIGVPLSFGGAESPEPPPPPGGWPSGYPITIYAAGLTVSEHSLTVAGTGKPLEHVWLSPGDRRAEGLLQEEFMLYAFHPLVAGTTYRVRVAGTQGGAPITLEWTFSTRATR
jgi:hypothetical protein